MKRGRLPESAKPLRRLIDLEGAEETDRQTERASDPISSPNANKVQRRTAAAAATTTGDRQRRPVVVAIKYFGNGIKLLNLDVR